MYKGSKNRYVYCKVIGSGKLVMPPWVQNIKSRGQCRKSEI